MPPKKAASSTTNPDATESSKFTWEGPNETKLLLLILGRHVQTSEFETIASAIPGATGGAIRNRMSVLRLKQKKLYEELGWELPSGTATAAKKGGKGASKRAAGEDGGEVETPTKKARGGGKKKKGETEPLEKDGGAGDGEEMGDGVKVESEPEEV
ncbi:hypothetical protein EJ07DRAFT_175383 [Lizonia empirigonia]|nr:hypothetical protein EJ07DRAFT_175383 [Lizonia empirigonia]